MYEVEIEKLDYFARGIGKIDGKIIFIPKALVGDKVLVAIVKDNKKYLEGKVISYINKVKRIGKCPYSDKCGGCPLIDLDYQEQLSFKIDKIKNLLARNLNIDKEIGIIEGKNNYNYRNKVTLHVKNENIGYYQEESNEVVNIDKCVIAKEEINKVISKLKKIVLDNNIEEVVIKSHEGLLLSIKGNISKELLLNNFNECEVIYLNNNLIKGNGYVRENILNYSFRISLKSFFQVNKEVCSNIFKKVISYISDKNYKRVLDLYCGTGIISIIISKYVEEVIGIEIEADAVKDAIYNKEDNDINNVTFICDKVENRIGEFKDIDLVIVDPPRSGLDKKSIDNILKMRPKDIIYISCNPITLVRDLKLLSEFYNISDLSIADMFPNTYHVECVCLLNLR